MEYYRDIYKEINNHSLTELYMENDCFLARGRACFEDDRIYFKLYEPSLSLDVGEIFLLKSYCLKIEGQLVSFVDSVGEFLVLSGDFLPKDGKIINPTKDALILFENNILKDRWGTLLVKEPYFLARIININSKGAKIISSANKSAGDQFYLAIELDLFERVVKCQIISKMPIDEYAEDFMYEVRFLDIDSEVSGVLSRIEEGKMSSEG